MRQQKPAAGGRVAKSEAVHRFPAHTSATQILKRRLPFRRIEKSCVKEKGSFFHGLAQRLAIRPWILLFSHLRLGQGDAVSLGDKTYSLGKRDLFELHHKFEDIPAGAAAVAVEYLLFLADGE